MDLICAIIILFSICNLSGKVKYWCTKLYSINGK